MYSVLDYGEMVADRVRMDAYARAIERAVEPGDVVLDIGAGTGVMSLLAARAGARRVHAVDPNPAIHLLPELAKENGLGDRIEVHAMSSLELELPEKANVVVSDLRGSFPLNAHHVAILRDARARLLAPGGILIPARDRMFVAVVDSVDVERRLQRGVSGYERLGFRTTTLRASIANSVYTDAAGPVLASDMLTTEGVWFAVEYGAWEGALAEGTVTLAPRRRGTGIALAVWFEASIHEELGYANAPGTALAYARLVLPLERPMSLEIGDRVEVTLRVDERGRRWAWECAVVDPAGVERAKVRQSTFFGAPTSMEALVRRSRGFKPELSPRGARASAALASMNGQRTVAEIADAVIAEGTSMRPSVDRELVLEEIDELVASYCR